MNPSPKTQHPAHQAAFQSKAPKYGRLAYSASWNLGDHIQTLATEQFLGNDPTSIERDKLEQYKGDDVILLMQGYFFVNERQCSFPPANNILPVFIGFHIEDSSQTRSFYSSPRIVSYLQRHSPIGCRDETTQKFLEENGIESYLSRCLTLTFPRRKESIKGEKIFFIDTPNWLKPSRFFGEKFNTIYKNALFLTQVVDTEIAILSDSVKRAMAESRIKLLREKAKLVVTTRLHIAAPCIAMGIPVVLIPREVTQARYGALKNLIPIYQFPTRRFILFGRYASTIRRLVQIIYVRFLINWNPIPPNIDSLKFSMGKNVRSKIKEVNK